MPLPRGMRLPAIALIVGFCIAAQPSKKQAGAGAADKTQPKFKAIWEPVNVKEDIELQSVRFSSPGEGWVAGGRTVMRGVILHTTDGGATWQIELGDPGSSDRAYNDLRFAGPALFAVQSTGIGDHKLLRL